MIRQKSSAEAAGLNQQLEIAKAQAISCFQQFQTAIVSPGVDDAHIRQGHRLIHTLVALRWHGFRVVKRMQAPYKNAVTAISFRRQTPIAKLQLTSGGNRPIGTLTGSRSVAGIPLAIREYQIAVQSDA